MGRKGGGYMGGQQAETGPRILRESEAQRLSWLRTKGCQRSGRHWHVIRPDPLFPSGARGFVEHSWAADQGHSGDPDPERRHTHVWTEATVTAAYGPVVHNEDRLRLIVGRLAGTVWLDPSIDREPDPMAYAREEELAARTLHPELRPSRLRDA